jgi:SPP1 gp7 family putative phage head morphogenesis protein
MADVHQLPGVPADPLRFDEAIRAFRRRSPVTDEVFDLMLEVEREFAFTLANVAQADLVSEVYDAIDRAIRDGTTLEDFKAEVGTALEEAWGGEQPARLEAIFRTNVQGAYNAGRFDRMTAPAAKRARPFWRFDAIADSRTTPFCRGADGVVLPADDPWWKSRYPPAHHNCRSVVTPLTEDEAKDEGITRSPPPGKAADGFGKAPSTTGADWEPEPRDYPAPIAAELEEKLG